MDARRLRGCSCAHLPARAAPVLPAWRNLGGGLDAGGAGSIAERWRRPRSKPQFLTPSLKQASGQNRTEAGTTARNGHSLPAIPHEGLFDNAACIEYQNPVGALGGCQAVRDDEGRAA